MPNQYLNHFFNHILYITIVELMSLMKFNVLNIQTLDAGSALGGLCDLTLVHFVFKASSGTRSSIVVELAYNDASFLDEVNSGLAYGHKRITYVAYGSPSQPFKEADMDYCIGLISQLLRNLFIYLSPSEFRSMIYILI